MSKLGLNIGSKYEVISSPLSSETLLQSNNLKPNQIILSSVPNGEGDDSSVELVATDANGYAFNLTNAINNANNSYNTHAEIGKVFAHQIKYPSDELIFKFSPSIAIGHDITIDANNKVLSYTPAYINSYSTICFDPQFVLDNNILKISDNITTTTTEHVTNTQFELLPNDDIVYINGSGTYKTKLAMKTNIPNVIANKTITTTVHGPKFTIYAGILSGLLDEIISQYAINNGITINSDYLSVDLNAFPITDDVLTFINNKVTITNNCYVSGFDPLSEEGAPIATNVDNCLYSRSINNNFSDISIEIGVDEIAITNAVSLERNNVSSRDIKTQSHITSSTLIKYPNAEQYISMLRSNNNPNSQKLANIYQHYVENYYRSYIPSNISMRYGCWCIIPQDIYDEYNVIMYDYDNPEASKEAWKWETEQAIPFSHYNGTSYEDLVLLKFYDKQHLTVNTAIEMSKTIIMVEFTKKQ